MSVWFYAFVLIAIGTIQHTNKPQLQQSPPAYEHKHTMKLSLFILDRKCTELHQNQTSPVCVAHWKDKHAVKSVAWHNFRRSFGFSYSLPDILNLTFSFSFWKCFSGPFLPVPPETQWSVVWAGQGSWRTCVIRQHRTCFVTLGGKAWTYLGKCPLIPSYTHLFLSDSSTAWREFLVLPVSKYLKAQSTQSKKIKGMFYYFFLYY